VIWRCHKTLFWSAEINYRTYFCPVLRRCNSVPSFWFRVPNCQGDHKRRRSIASPSRWYQKRQKPWRLEMVEIKINWYSQVSKAMRSVNIIEYSIIMQIESNISRIFWTDYNAIISVFLHVSKMAVFRVSRNDTKQIAKRKCPEPLYDMIKIVIFVQFSYIHAKNKAKTTCFKAKSSFFN